MFNRSKLENEAGKLVKKSGQLLEVGKMKLQLASLENDRYNLKAELGDAVYKAYESKCDNPEIETICRQIDDLNGKIEEIKGHIEQVK